jgi:hypothetical protein
VDGTTILIRNETRERLKGVGKKNQTYDQLISELIELKIKKNCDSPDREVGSLQSSESESPLESVSPMSQDIKLTQNLCEGNGCNQRATAELQLNAGQKRSITLYLCDSCINKFRD